MRSKYQGQFLAGMQIGKWTVITGEVVQIKTKTAYGPAGIGVRCICGSTKIVEAGKLSTGKTTQCKKCINGTLADNSNWKGVRNIPGRYYNNVKRRAGERNLEFSLSITYLADLYDKQRGRCALTGDPIFFSEARKYALETSASLDRIDNSKGYIEGNVQFVSKKVNFAKHKTAQHDFIDMCMKVYLLHGAKSDS